MQDEEYAINEDFQQTALQFADALDLDEIESARIVLEALADAEVLCGTRDALLAGQYHHLRGRIAALIELTVPIDHEEGAA